MRVYRDSTEPHQIIRVDRAVRATTDRDVELYREGRIRARGVPEEMRAEALARFAAIPHRPELPWIADLIVDRNGRLWVREFSRPAEAEAVWTIFDADGQLVAVARTPNALQVEEIGADYILAQWRDELDVPFVRMYALERDGDPTR